MRLKKRGGFLLRPRWHLWNPPPEPIQKSETSGWTINSRRVGIIARKVAMVPGWDEWLRRHGFTVLQIEDCQVTQVKEMDKHPTTTIQVGSTNIAARKLSKPVRRHLQKNGVAAKRILHEFKVTPEAVIPVGTPILATHFVPGQFVDIRGRIKGKGFMGVMKRWGFRGQPASHGASLSHRSAGSTGVTGVGRTWKGTKMAGRSKSKYSTQQRLLVWKVMPKQNAIWVKGHVPGYRGNYVFVTDTKVRPYWPKPPPFPTHIPEEGYVPEDELTAATPPPWAGKPGDHKGKPTSEDMERILKEAREEYSKQYTGEAGSYIEESEEEEEKEPEFTKINI